MTEHIFSKMLPIELISISKVATGCTDQDIEDVYAALKKL